jgi:subfamily B ATP-binding cassette protein HlyB/CyaB
VNCLLLLASYHGVPADLAAIEHEFGNGGELESTHLVLAARSLGFSAKCVRPKLSRLKFLQLPAIGRAKDNSYFIVAKTDLGSISTPVARESAGRVLIQADKKNPEMLTLEDFLELWDGELIVLQTKADAATSIAIFDFTWFIPAIIKYRKIFYEILLISITLQVIGLITPLFFQVVMDKVLVNSAYKTLNVIGFALFFTIIFDIVLTAIRSFAFSSTASKMDVELGSRLFTHLLTLPLPYFQSRRAGDSVARIRELENIRSFLTGNALSSALDILFSVVFFTAMFYYSKLLAFIVLGSVGGYLAISLLFTPVLRARLDVKFNKSAENQAFLVESLTGIDTIKSLAVEPRWRRRWEQQLATYVTTSLSVANIGVLATACVTFLNKSVTALILWVGAIQVINHDLSVGQLIAFNMLAGQVSTPILRLAQMWSDFQQVGISMARLGDILNAKPELSEQRQSMPVISGRIVFHDVAFRYKPDGRNVIEQLNVEIQPGQTIGIVGRSGSGKSTFGKLLQRLYIPTDGRITIDGIDINTVGASSLRRQIGVVQQENVLFNRTIRENIALTDPSATLERVVECAKLAGAHDFVCALADGYGTVLGEQGGGLSGGQRQRIAIARALLGNPRILIFDEATSALDYESERAIQDNMKMICAGKTTIVIAHRLSAVRDADLILVMEKGRIVEIGTHDTLVKVGGIYHALNSMQYGGSDD